MRTLKLFSVFMILTLFSCYLFVNFKQFDEGAGHGLLAVLLLLSLGQQAFAGAGLLTVPRLRKSSVALLFFIGYVCFRLIIDTGDLMELRKYMLSTSGGIMFALCMGFILSVQANQLYISLQRNGKRSRWVLWLALTYLVFTSALLLAAFKVQIGFIRPDIFLIENQDGSYQRPGAFIFMQFMVNCALVALMVCSAQRNRMVERGAKLVLTAYALIAMFFAQLIGSNSAFVTIGLFLTVFFAYSVLSEQPGLQEGNIRIGIRALLFGWMGKRLLVLACITLCVGVPLALLTLRWADVDLSLFRITGFGSGSNSSIDSRLTLLRSNFITQLSYNPLFGNTQVDALTTGKGSYVHCIFSILTHCGIFGFTLFVLFILLLYMEITAVRPGPLLYDSNRYSLFRLAALTATLTISALATFYNWMPLWFCIGLFGVRFHRSLERLPLQQLPGAFATT